MTDGARTLAGAIGFLILGIAVFVKAGDYRTGGADLFPKAAAGIMIAASLGLIVTELLRRGARGASGSIEVRLEAVGPRMALVIGLSLAFVAAMPWLGMASASFLFIVASCWSLGLRRPVMVIGGAAAFALIVPFVFVHFLHVRPPRELVMVVLSGL